MSSHDQLNLFLARAKPEHAAVVMHIFHNSSPNDADHQWSEYMKFLNIQSMYDLDEHEFLALITVFPELNAYQLFDTVLDYRALKPHLRDYDPWELCIYLQKRQHIPPILAKDTGLPVDVVRDAMREHPTYTIEGHRTTLSNLKFKKLIENKCPEDLASRYKDSAETIAQIMQRAASSRPSAEMMPRQVAAVGHSRGDRVTYTQRLVSAIKAIPTNGHMELRVGILTAIINPSAEVGQYVSLFEDVPQSHRVDVPFYDDLFLLRHKSDYIAMQLAHTFHGRVTTDISTLSYMREVLNVCHALTRQELSNVELEVLVQNALERAGGINDNSISMYIQSWTKSDYQLDVHQHVLKFHTVARV